MAQTAVQASFNSGEWSPNLYSRVDMAKYKSGAALLENFYVDYRGGVSTRTGTQYCIQAYKSGTDVRLIPFQASTSVGYVVEVGNGYMRFIYQGAPVVETGVAISGANKATPCVLTVGANNFAIGDWIYVSGVGGMTQLNGKYFIISALGTNTVSITDLFGVPVNSTGYGTYTSGGTASRILTIASPYTSANNLRLIKYAQSINQLVLCHPNYPAYVLSNTGGTNWSLAPIIIGPTLTAPTFNTTNAIIGNTPAQGTSNSATLIYQYVVTSIDANGQESGASAVIRNAIVKAGATTATGTLFYNMRLAVSMSIQLKWNPVPGAVGYNVYESVATSVGGQSNPGGGSTNATVEYPPAGMTFGYIGSTTNSAFTDTNIAQDFSTTPPIVRNPFGGYPVSSVVVTASGYTANSNYTTVPVVTFDAGSNPCNVPAQATATLGVQAFQIRSGSLGYAANDTVTCSNGVIMRVLTVDGSGRILSASVLNSGSIASGSVPTNPVLQVSTSGVGTGARFDFTWGVNSLTLTNRGAGYTVPPAIVFNPAGAAATATLDTTVTINPTVPAFVQQRLVLAAPTTSPASFFMSQPGQYFNFNISLPVKANNAVSGTLVSGTQHVIKSIIGASAGMIILTDRAEWVVNGGSSGAAITPSSAVANPQSFIGASDVPPIVANYDILFVQSKGSAVRDLAYNVYYNIFTGSDISITASHLFYGYTIDEWAWAEQPFYLVQAIRSDGQMLTLTFLKEQDFVAWTHYVTTGQFKSVVSITETSGTTSVDAVYTVVQRTINGNVVKYIERFADRATNLANSWCVDAGIKYSGPSVTSFSGGESLAGMSVTGLATDSLGITRVITPFTMPVNGNFTLTPVSPATGFTTVIIGLSFTCKLQTLPLDVGDPTIQGKVKKIPSVDIRVANTLGLQIGSSFTNLVTMKDLVVGNVSSAKTGQVSQVVTGLVDGDAKTFLDPTYTVPGQYCIQQSLPYPATVLGVFPNFVTEDRHER